MLKFSLAVIKSWLPVLVIAIAAGKYLASPANAWASVAVTAMLSGLYGMQVWLGARQVDATSAADKRLAKLETDMKELTSASGFKNLKGGR